MGLLEFKVPIFSTPSLCPCPEPAGLTRGKWSEGVSTLVVYVEAESVV